MREVSCTQAGTWNRCAHGTCADGPVAQLQTRIYFLRALEWRLPWLHCGFMAGPMRQYTSLTHSLTPSIPRSFVHSRTHSFTHALTHSLPPSFTWVTNPSTSFVTHPPSPHESTHLLLHVLPCLFVHSFMYAFIFSWPHSPTHSLPAPLPPLTRSLTRSWRVTHPRSLTHNRLPTITWSLIHSFTRAPTLPPIPSPTHPVSSICSHDFMRGRNILAYRKDVHCYLSCSSSWWSCSFLTRKPSNSVSFLPINEFVYADDTYVVATDPCRAETHEMHRSNGNELWFSPQCEEMRCIAYWVRSLHHSLWRKFPYMQSIDIISRKLFGCHWRWRPGNLQTIGWNQKAIRQTGENMRESGGIPLCTPNKRSVSSKFVSCQSCCITCTQCGWIIGGTAGNIWVSSKLQTARQIWNLYEFMKVHVGE